MGIEGLYTVSACPEKGSTAFIAALDPSHPVFAGHFPGMPVLPGVCTMHIVKVCASRAAGRDLKYGSVAEVKFLSAIIPTVNPELEVKLELGEPAADGSRTLRGEVAAGGTTVLKIKAVLV